MIPFDNQISKDTDLYKLYNTNIHEKIAEQKAREEAGEYVVKDEKIPKSSQVEEKIEKSEPVKRHSMGTFVG